MSDKYNTSLETNLNKVRVVLILSYVTKLWQIEVLAWQEIKN
jgi:hypothetical protein